MQTKPTRVLLADDHEMVLEIFALYLRESAGMDIVTARSLDEGMDRIADSGPFDVVLLDLNMPGMNGVAGLKRAIKASDGRPVAIITGAVAPRMVDEIMNSGAAGVILKTTTAKSLANAISFMEAGEQYVPLSLLRERKQAGKSVANKDISDREMAVLGFLSEGKQNKDIANQMNIAEPTVKMHVTSLCRKLGAQNRTQVVIMARDLGLV